MIVIVMGVCGAGKTTVGELIAENIGARFLEGDRFHPAANVEKMSRGEPLDDADRAPWLEKIADSIDQWTQAGDSVVIACSALKESYRQTLIGDRTNVRLVFLHGSPELLADRMASRQHHFMPAGLLPSQLATLEAPSENDHTISADVADPPTAIANRVTDWIRATT